MEGFVQMSQDEQFVEILRQHIELTEKLLDLAKTGNLSLKSQRFEIEAGHRTIVNQEKQIMENKDILKDAKDQVIKIIEVAKEEAKRIKDASLTLVAERNTLLRETQAMKEEAEKILWDAKKKVMT